MRTYEAIFSVVLPLVNLTLLSKDARGRQRRRPLLASGFWATAERMPNAAAHSRQRLRRHQPMQARYAWDQPAQCAVAVVVAHSMRNCIIGHWHCKSN
jgi:hypothetical protein